MVEWRFDLYYRAALGMPAGQLGRAGKARLRFCETLGASESGGFLGSEPAAQEPVTVSCLSSK